MTLHFLEIYELENSRISGTAPHHGEPMTIKTLTPTDQRAPAEGTGSPALSPGTAESIVIVRNFQPGQVVRVIFLTPDQAKQLPTLPADALQIAVAPAGGL